MFSPPEDPESSRRNNPNLPDLYKTAHIPNVVTLICAQAGEGYEHWSSIFTWPAAADKADSTAVKSLPRLRYN